MGTPTSTQYSVLLVHGTWGRGIWRLSKVAKWADEGSPLCLSLRARLTEVQIHREPWTGGNTFRSRHAGAAVIERKLQQLLSAAPSRKHYVIAHSHGGTITLKALRNEALSSQLAGVVCLATPFPALVLRSLVDNSAKSGEYFMGWFAAIVGAVLGMILGLGLRSPSESWFQAMWFGGSLGAMIGLPAGEYLPFSGYADMCRRFVEKHGLPTTRPFRLFNVRVPGDEAEAVLHSSHFLGAFAARSMALLPSIAALAIILGFVIVFVSGREAHEVIVPLVGTFAILGVAPTFAVFISLAAFDWLAAFYSFGVEISAKSEPPGDSDSFALGVGPGVQHCRPYDDSASLDAVCRWILSGEASRHDSARRFDHSPFGCGSGECTPTRPPTTGNRTPYSGTLT